MARSTSPLPGRGRVRGPARAVLLEVDLTEVPRHACANRCRRTSPPVAFHVEHGSSISAHSAFTLPALVDLIATHNSAATQVVLSRRPRAAMRHAAAQASCRPARPRSAECDRHQSTRRRHAHASVKTGPARVMEAAQRQRAAFSATGLSRSGAVVQRCHARHGGVQRRRRRARYSRLRRSTTCRRAGLRHLL